MNPLLFPSVAGGTCNRRDSTTPPACPSPTSSHCLLYCIARGRCRHKHQLQAGRDGRDGRESRKDCDEQPSPTTAYTTLEDEDDDVSWGSWDDQEDPNERDTEEGCNDDADDGRGLRGSAAAAAPPRHGIRVESGGNGEKGNERVEAQSPGGPTEDPRKRDEPVRGDPNPRKTALKDITNRNPRGTRPGPKKKKRSAGLRVTPNDRISRLSDGVGVKRVGGEAVLINYERLLQVEMTRRLVLQRTVGELRARVDALAPGAVELAEARDEIARLRGLVGRREGTGPGGLSSAGRARGRTGRQAGSRTLRVSSRVIALGGMLWLAIVNLSVHSGVGRLLSRQRRADGEERRRAYLRRHAAPGRSRRRHAGDGAATEESGESSGSAPRVGTESDSNSTADAADGGPSAGSTVNGTSIDAVHVIAP